MLNFRSEWSNVCPKAIPPPRTGPHVSFFPRRPLALAGDWREYDYIASLPSANFVVTIK